MESEACITGSQVKTQIPDGFQWKPLKDKSDTEGWQGGRYVISSRTFFQLVDYEVLGVSLSSFLVISQLGSTCFWSACRQLLPPGGGFSICKTTQRIWQSSIVLEEKRWNPGGSVVKNPLANARDKDSLPGSGRSLGEVKGNPLQYSCLENPMNEQHGELQSWSCK